MKSQLYLYPHLRDYLKSQISSFARIFNEKLFPAFEHIEVEANEYTEDIFNKLCETCASEDSDGSDFAESATDRGIVYYKELSLVKYSFTAMSISNLYHMWEQQIRKFLYDEISHLYKIQLKTFCPNGINWESFMLPSNDNVKTLSVWNKIDELRLLCNVIKHADGKSAITLRQKNKTLFKKSLFDNKIPETLDTTLLDENLLISQDLFKEYVDALIEFWDVLPDGCYWQQPAPKIN